LAKMTVERRDTAPGKKGKDMERPNYGGETIHLEPKKAKKGKKTIKTKEPGGQEIQEHQTTIIISGTKMPLKALKHTNTTQNVKSNARW